MTPDPSTLSREEIARCVAVEVMGWEIASTKASYRQRSPDGGRDTIIMAHDWKPAENIAHAWQVVEKMKERGVYLDIISIDDGWMVGNGGRGYADDDGRVDIELESHATAPTAPLAICLAALQAVRGG